MKTPDTDVSDKQPQLTKYEQILQRFSDQAEAVIPMNEDDKTEPFILKDELETARKPSYSCSYWGGFKLTGDYISQRSTNKFYRDSVSKLDLSSQLTIYSHYLKKLLILMHKYEVL